MQVLAAVDHDRLAGDDLAAAALAHARHHLTAGEEHRRDVDVHHAPPLLERDLLERTHLERRVEAGVVDEHVYRPAARDRLVDHPPDVILARDVDGEAYAVGERAGGLLRPGEVGDDDACAVARETLGDRAADPLRRARDDGDLPVERAHQRSGEKAVGTRIRFRWVWISGWILPRNAFQRSSAWRRARRSSRCAKFS